MYHVIYRTHPILVPNTHRYYERWVDLTGLREILDFIEANKGAELVSVEPVEEDD